MYYMETAYGQLICCRLSQRYGIIEPGAWGFILVQVTVCFLVCVYYVTLMSWSFIFFFDSFKNPLPWTVKKAIPESEVPDGGEAPKEAIWNENYLWDVVIDKSSGIDDTSKFVPMVTFCMFLSYVVLYFCVFKGLKSTGKMVYVTCLGPYLVLFILMIRGFTLEGAGLGLKFLFAPDLDKLFVAKIWKDAAVQILFSSGVSFGPLMFYGSARQTDEKIIPATYGVPLANSATSLFAACTTFPFLGHVATLKGIPVADVSSGGIDLAFVAFPGLLNEIAWSNMWAVIFFFMMLCLGVDSAFGFVDFFIQFMVDLFPSIL